MGKASNKLEYSKRLASCYNSNSSCAVDIKQVDDTTIHQECSKKLRSRCFVNSNSKPKFNWNYNQPKSFGVYHAVGNLWLCRDRKIKELSECEREQIRLYNRLKREYEREQKLLNSNDTITESVVTQEEKKNAKKQKIAYNFNWYNIDKLYGIKRLW